MIAWKTIIFARDSMASFSPPGTHPPGRCSCVMSEAENTPMPDCVDAEDEAFCRCVVENGGSEDQVGREGTCQRVV